MVFFPESGLANKINWWIRWISSNLDAVFIRGIKTLDGFFIHRLVYRYMDIQYKASEAFSKTTADSTHVIWWFRWISEATVPSTGAALDVASTHRVLQILSRCYTIYIDKGFQSHVLFISNLVISNLLDPFKHVYPYLGKWSNLIHIFSTR